MGLVNPNKLLYDWCPVTLLRDAVSSDRVCHVVACVNQAVGGPAFSVTSLAQSLAQQNLKCHLFSLDYPKLGPEIPTIGVIRHSYYAPLPTRLLRGFYPRMRTALEQLAATEFDLIHNHGLWMFPNLYARQVAVKYNLPLVISPRGMLESWSLRNSWYKKLPAWILYERENLKSAQLFHATSAAEAESIRKLGYRQAIALIPNGVSVPTLDKIPDRELLTRSFPELGNKKWLLFLSRIHPKKGLDNLLYIWRELAVQFPEWHLVIAGPDLIGYQAQLEKLTAELELKTRVTFTGMLSGEYKSAAFGHADLFVLPTHSENFGIVVTESLAYGVPAIVTKEAPWEDLQHYECGWWVEDDRQALTEALEKGMCLSDRERQAMGQRGQVMVKTKYSWDYVAREMSQVYRWLMTGGQPPSCVLFPDEEAV